MPWQPRTVAWAAAVIAVVIVPVMAIDEEVDAALDRAVPAAPENVRSESSETRRSLRAVLLQTAREPSLSILLRRRAVHSLLDRDDPAVADALVAALAPGGDASFQRIIAQTLVQRVLVPEVFAQPLIELLSTADELLAADVAAVLGRYRSLKVTGQLIATVRDERASVAQRCAAIQAMAHHRTQQTAGVLVQLLRPNQPASVVAAADEALKVLTGLDQGGAPNWQRWWEQRQAMPRARWWEQLAENHAHRARQLEDEKRELIEQLLETNRQLYRATPQDEREARLVAWLAGVSLSMRQLALDFMWQRLSDQQLFAVPLRQALLPALGDANASIRLRVARLLRDLGDEEGAKAMEARLIERLEDGTAVLEVYLLVIAEVDDPRPQSIHRAIELLADDALQNAAAAVLVSAAEKDLLAEPLRVRLLMGLRRRIDAEAAPVPKIIELLGHIGDADVWRLIEFWIDSKQDQVKEAAAVAWVRSGRRLLLLAKRADDLRIGPILIAAAAVRGRDPAVFRLLLALEPQGEQKRQAWQRALVAMAGRLPGAVILAADSDLAAGGRTNQEQVLDLRLQLLSAAIVRAMSDLGLPLDGAPPPPADPAALVELVLRRAEIRLGQSEPKAALGDLNLVSMRQWSLTERQSATHDDLAMRAKLANGDADGAFQIAVKLLEQARSKNGDRTLRRAAADLAPAFLDAARRHHLGNQTEHASAILSRLTELVGALLSARLKQQLEQLRAQVGRAKWDDRIQSLNGGRPFRQPGTPGAVGNADGVRKLRVPRRVRGSTGRRRGPANAVVPQGD